MKNVKQYLHASLSIAVVIALTAFSGSAQPVDEVTPAERESPQDREKRIQQSAAVNARGLTAAAAPQCFTSGSPAGSSNDPRGLSFLKVCVTDRGNISHLESPAGKIHVRGSEGYLVCSVGGIVHGFDTGGLEDGWLPSTVSQPKAGQLPLIVTRDSIDGKVRLTQTFTMIAGDREVQVAMVLKNISPVPMSFSLTRYFDADVDGGGSDDRYDMSKDSVWGLQTSNSLPSSTNGIMLTEAVPAQPNPSIGEAQFFIETYSGWNPTGPSFQSARLCIPMDRAVGPTSTGDFIGRAIKPLGLINPGQSKSVTLKYRRF